MNLQFPKEDLIGKVFNNWKVLKLSHKGGIGLWYWDIQCTNCGLIATRFTNYVKKSKGCICCNLLPKGETGLNKVVSSYQDSAKVRGYKFTLTKEEVRELTSSSCYYCGNPPNKIKSRKYKNGRSDWGNYVYNGIDRIDNSKGYTNENCVPCCEMCNRGKGSISLTEWLSYIQRMAKHMCKTTPFLRNEDYKLLGYTVSTGPLGHEILALVEKTTEQGLKS